MYTLADVWVIHVIICVLYCLDLRVLCLLAVVNVFHVHQSLPTVSLSSFSFFLSFLTNRSQKYIYWCVCVFGAWLVSCWVRDSFCCCGLFCFFSILLNVFHMRPDTQVDAIYEPEWLKPHRSEHVHTRQERDRDREIEREIKRKPSTIGRN